MVQHCFGEGAEALQAARWLVQAIIGRNSVSLGVDVGWVGSEFGGAAGEAVDGALFVAGGAVLFLLGDGGQVCGVVFGRHGYGAEEEAGEGGVAI